MTRVLIVDDDPGFRRLAALLLEQEGFSVVGEAADGTTAARLAREAAPDIVLLDVNLTGESGFDVARRIAGAPDAPAVVLTSTRDESDYAALALETGARGFVAKDELSSARIERLVG
jgi:DNA-binding NarL/FixJ family response regulator